ncbi:hypothetical protein OG288_17940 [Streptomyces tauricus]|uniref:Uncharacterized protein n=1 Tax=Streptomyces tauricus TaxID=68274 RepID=A0ABZ1JEJ0_9ACTN|nr:hypothetical protein [Streptomyces tauricus]
MAEQQLSGSGASGPDVGGPSGESTNWDFRLDRSGLFVKAGRHLQLQVSMALLLWLIAAVAGWGATQWEWPPVP